MVRGRSAEVDFILDEGDDSGETAASAPPLSQFGHFSQIDPDQSQFLDVARASEKAKLDGLNPTARNQIVTDLSRILLFKGFSGETIDRTKCIAEALGESFKKERVGNAAMDEAKKRLEDVFGFAVRRVPAKMEEDLPSRFKNRLFLINNVADDEDGTHSLNIHSANKVSSAEKGLLVMILAFAFCKGSSQVRSGQMKGAGKKTRWITEHHLYSLLHRVDEGIPSEPPSAEGKKKSRMSSGGGGGRRSLSPGDLAEGAGQTPDVDVLLERFVGLDYLLRDKIEEPEGRESQAGEDGKVVAYAMGPRAAMEIGRKQIIHFCSDILEEQPDPTMLAEIEEDEESEEEEEEEEEEVEEETKGKRRRKQ